MPATLLWAAYGLRGEPGGLYTADRLAAAGLDPATVSTEQMPDANHFTALVGDAGAGTVAARVLEAATLV